MNDSRNPNIITTACSFQTVLVDRMPACSPLRSVWSDCCLAASVHSLKPNNGFSAHTLLPFSPSLPYEEISCECSHQDISLADGCKPCSDCSLEKQTSNRWTCLGVISRPFSPASCASAVELSRNRGGMRAGGRITLPGSSSVVMFCCWLSSGPALQETKPAILTPTAGAEPSSTFNPLKLSRASLLLGNQLNQNQLTVANIPHFKKKLLQK